MSGEKMKLPGISIAILDKPGMTGGEPDKDDEQIMFDEMAKDLIQAVKEGDSQVLGAILRTFKDMCH